MKKEKFDAIIIGTGQAGPFLANSLAQAGMKTTVIERKLFGGTCVNVGCTPTKTMVASARAAYMARRASDFGVNISGDITIDIKKVMDRKDDIVGRSNHEAPEWLTSNKNITVYKGHARFIDERTIDVNDQVLESEKIFINVGGRAFIPDMPGLDEIDYLTNSNLMQMDEIPKHLVIIGGSYIGLEFAQIYRRFGSEVTVIEKGSRLISREDEDVSETVKQILENEGIKVRLNAECMSVKKSNGQISIGVDCKTGDNSVLGSHLLLAVGRVPNTDDLGLDKAHVKTDKRGYIEIDDHLMTNVPGIWALGDCNGQGAFTHTAYNDFEIVAANLLNNDPRKVSDRLSCYGLFIDPPLGRVGMTEAQAKATGRNILIGKRPMTKVSRAKEKGETQGFMKVLIDAESKEFLGAAILGVGGDEVVHSILNMMYAKQPYTTMQRAVHIHPTVTELIPTMLADLKPLEF